MSIGSMRSTSTDKTPFPSRRMSSRTFSFYERSKKEVTEGVSSYWKLENRGRSKGHITVVPSQHPCLCYNYDATRLTSEQNL